MARGAPLVGRDGLIAEAVAALGDRGAVLAGPRGAGRTRLLAACAERAGPNVLVVDDLHLLPLGDAAALREHVAAGTTPLLATVAAGAVCSEPVVRLWRDDGVIRVDVPPLDADAVAIIAGRRADGPVEAATVQRLLALSGGLPRDLVELVDAAADHDWFDRQHGVVRLRPGLPVGLLNRHGAELASQSDDARLVVELAAVGRNVPVVVLTTLGSQAGLAEARAAGLVAVELVDAHLVARPASPLMGELVRMSLDYGKRRDHRAALADALTSAAAPVLTPDAKRLVAEAHSDAGFVDPAHIALARDVVEVGLRDGRSDVVDLAAAVWRASDDPADGLALSLAYDHAGRPADQAAVAADVAQRAPDDHTSAVATDRLASALVRLGRDDEAIEELNRGLGRVVDPAAHARLTIALANRQLHAGDLAAAIARTEPLLGLGVPVPEAALVAAVAHAASGRCGRALELADVGEEMLIGGAAETGELVGPLLAVARALALTEAGRLDEAEAAVTFGSETAGFIPRFRYQNAWEQAVAVGDRPRQGWIALALGRIELARGRARRALRYFGDAIAGFGDLGEIGYVAWAVAGRAAALALLGDVDGAREAASRRDALPHDRLGLFEPESQRLLALVEVCAGEVDAARERLSAAATHAGDQLVARAWCLHDLVRVAPSDDIVHELAALATATGEARVALLAEHASALVAVDPTRLKGVAAAFADGGAWLEAALTFVEVSRVAGDARDEAFARRRAWANAARCEGAAPPTLAGLAPVALTARQLDAVTLAAAGLSRPAIASQLFLSDRTVDRHLNGAFAALGVRHQDQLAEALEDLRVAGLATRPGTTVERSPLVARDDEANAMRRAVADPAVRAVVLTGPVGCGKTRLAAQLQSELADRGWMAVTIRGTAPREAAMETLASALAAESVALVVDDVGLLGGEGVAAVRTAINSLSGFTFLTTSDGAVPDGLDRNDLVRVDIGPLPIGGVRDVLAAAVNGPVLGTTVAAFERASGGNALLLRELVRGAWATGQLVERDGVWALVGPLAPSPPLQELIRGHLGSLTASSRRTLELLAVTGTLPLALAEMLIAPDELRVVVDSGLAERDGSGVSLSHESYGAEILAQLPPDARAQRLATVLDAVADHGLDVDPLRLARWSMQAGRKPAAALLLAAASQALHLADPATGVEMAEQAAIADPDGDGLLLSAVARSMLAQLDEADAQLAAVGTTRAALIRSDVALWLANDLNRAVAALDAVREPSPEVTAQRELIDVLARRQVPSGELTDPRQLLVAVIGAADVGRPESGARLAEQAAVMVGDAWASFALANAITFQWVHCLIQAGHLDEALAVMQARRPGVHRRGPLAHPGPEEGRIALARGHIATATLEFRDALQHPLAARETMLRAEIRTGLALAAAFSGDAKAARVELGHLGASPRVGRLLHDLVRAEAWAAAAEGDRPAAIASLAAAARELVSASPGVAVVLAHDAVRLGGWTEAAMLAEVAGRVEGPLAAAQCAYAAGIVEREAAAMLAAAEGFAACGTDLFAAEAALTAAAWWDERGERRLAKHAAAAAQGWLSSCGGAATPAVQTRAAALTPRQLDIARLAAEGLSSRDIATRLGLSVRTIDNQLQRVYERLAVRSRRDLAAALATASTGTGS